MTLDDKRDDFYVAMVKFTFVCSNIPAAPAYGIYISHSIRYSRACGSFQGFRGRGLLLRRKPLSHRLLFAKLNSSLRKIQPYTYKDRSIRTSHKTRGKLRSSARVRGTYPTSVASSDMEIMWDTSKYK